MKLIHSTKKNLTNFCSSSKKISWKYLTSKMCKILQPTSKKLVKISPVKCRNSSWQKNCQFASDSLLSSKSKVLLCWIMQSKLSPFRSLTLVHWHEILSEYSFMIFSCLHWHIKDPATLVEKLTFCHSICKRMKRILIFPWKNLDHFYSSLGRKSLVHWNPNFSLQFFCIDFLFRDLKNSWKNRDA